MPELKGEVEIMQRATENYLPSDAFCHNDLLCVNFIFNEHEGMSCLSLINLFWTSLLLLILIYTDEWLNSLLSW